MRLTLLASLVFSLLPAAAGASIRTYFNHRPNSSYTDPLKQVNRAGDNLEAVLLQEMGRARRSLWIAVQEIRLPALAARLVEKKRAGVDVRVVLENAYNHDVLSRPPSNPNNTQEGEAEGSYDATRRRELLALVDANGDGRVTPAEQSTRDAVYMLRQGGVPVVDDTHDGSAGSGLMHHKFVIVDGSTTVVSSANFTPSCVHGDVLIQGSRGNANALVVMESSALSRLFAEEFSEMWEGRFGNGKRFRGARTVQVGSRNVTVQFSPSPRSVPWERTTNGLIAEALIRSARSIEAALFVFSEQGLADAMAEARGPQISVMVEKRFAFRSYSELLDLLGLEWADQRTGRVEEGNAPWRRPVERAGTVDMTPGDVLHHKFAVVDRARVLFGSHNWSEAANSVNDEFFLVIDDSSTAQDFSAEFARLARRASWGAPSQVGGF